MVRTDRFIAIVLIGIALFFYIQTGKFVDDYTNEPISASFFPRFILLSLIGCCGWLAIRSKLEQVAFPAPKNVLLGAIQVICYVLLIGPVGYFIVTPLFLFIFPASLGYRQWKWLTVLAVGGTLFSYIVFLNILGVPLPLGILEM